MLASHRITLDLVSQLITIYEGLNTVVADEIYHGENRNRCLKGRYVVYARELYSPPVGAAYHAFCA